VHLFHYHLVANDVRALEARYVGKLGFGLVARYGRFGERAARSGPGVPWESLDRDGFEPRLIELQQGSVNVVLQPGNWQVPRLDHLGVVMDDEDDFQEVLVRALSWNLPVQERSSARTFVSTNMGYRVEVHPPRPWIEELVAEQDELALADLQLRATEPGQKAAALADILGLDLADGDAVDVGGARVEFLDGGPDGRPELYAERFV
jgi:hypothetical protein